MSRYSDLRWLIGFSDPNTGEATEVGDSVNKAIRVVSVGAAPGAGMTDLEFAAHLPLAITAAALPLPAGAATSSKQDDLRTELLLKAKLTDTQPVSFTGISGTLQNAAMGSGPGTNLSVVGMASVSLTVNSPHSSNNIVFYGSGDGTNWTPIYGTSLGVNALQAAGTQAGTLWILGVSGLVAIRAWITVFAGGPITVTGQAFPTAGIINAYIPQTLTIQTVTQVVTVSTVTDITNPVSSKIDLTPQAPQVATVGVASAQALAGQATRRGLAVRNLSTSGQRISLGFGQTAVLDSGVTLYPQDIFQMDEYSFDKGALNAIASAASASLAMQEYLI